MIKNYGILIFVLLCALSCNRQVIPTAEKQVNYKSIEKDKEIEYQYALTEATKQNLLGNYKQAAALLHKCIDAYEESDAAMYELSKIYLRVQDKENAIHYAIRAKEIDSINYWYLYNLSQIYLFFYENDKALKIYEKVIELYPENYEIKYDLSLLYMDKKYYDKALNILNEIENKFGISEDVSLKKHQVYVFKNEFENAEKEILKLININPGEIKYYGILAELYSNNDKDELALEFYKKIFELDNNNGLAQLSFAEYLYNKGEVDSSFGYFAKAFANQEVKLEYKLDILFSFISDDEKIDSLSSNIFGLIQILNQGYENNERVKSIMADYYTKLEDYNRAVTILKEIVTINKKNQRVWEQLFYLLNTTKNYEELAVLCGEALKIFNGEVKYYLYKAIAEIQLNKHQDVVNTLNSGIVYIKKEDTEMQVQFYTFMGESYFKLKEYESSDIAFERVLEIEPENILVLNNYSYYLSVREVYLNKALEMSKIVIKKFPNNATYLDTYAWILYKQKKYREAKKYIEIAVNNGGDKDPDIVEHYGDILYMNNEKENAELLWKESKKLGNASENLERKIKSKVIISNHE